MYINLDCDGVLSNFTKAVTDLVGLEPEEITEWGFIKALEPSKREVVYSALSDSDFWGALEPYEGTQDAVERLKSFGDVTIVTSPWVSCVGWSSARRFWLQEHYGISERDVVVTNKKWLVYGDVFVDDKPEHVASWLRKWPNGIDYLMGRPYNLGATDGFRITSLDQVCYDLGKR